MRIHFLISGDLHKLTGGSIYNEKIFSGLKLRGFDVTIHHLNDDYPFPSDESRQQCKYEISTIRIGEPVIIDSLVFGVIPDFLKELAPTNPVIALIHLLLSSNPDFTACEHSLVEKSEHEALMYATKIIATSSFTESQLLNLDINKAKILVITPGVEEYPRKEGYKEIPVRLVCISNYTAGKGHIILARALSKLKDKDWELHSYGDLRFDNNYATQLYGVIQNYDLGDRIQVHPSLPRQQLSDVLLNADLFVHPSSFETYGMAITEALAHGIPVIASSGGGIRQTVPQNMGMFFESGDAAGLSLVLRELFENPRMYKNLCNHASMYYKQANSWQQSISLFESLLEEL